MKKDDKIIIMINAHIFNLSQMGRAVIPQHLKEWFAQLSPERLKPYLKHNDTLIREAALEVQKSRLN